MIKVEKWYATWCGPCQSMAPVLDAMHEEGVINLTSLDVEENMSGARANMIRGVPTLIVRDDDGKELARFQDVTSLRQYMAGEIVPTIKDDRLG